MSQLKTGSNTLNLESFYLILSTAAQMLISFLFYRLPFGLRQRLEPRCRVKSANEHE